MVRQQRQEWRRPDPDPEVVLREGCVLKLVKELAAEHSIVKAMKELGRTGGGERAEPDVHGRALSERRSKERRSDTQVSAGAESERPRERERIGGNVNQSETKDSKFESFARLEWLFFYSGGKNEGRGKRIQ